MVITKTVDELSPELKSSVVMFLMGWTIKPAWLDRNDEWVIYNRAGRYLHKFTPTEPELMGMVNLYDKHLMWLAWEAHLWSEDKFGVGYLVWRAFMNFDQKSWLDFIVEKAIDASPEMRQVAKLNDIFGKLERAIVDA